MREIFGSTVIYFSYDSKFRRLFADMIRRWEIEKIEEWFEERHAVLCISSGLSSVGLSFTEFCYPTFPSEKFGMFFFFTLSLVLFLGLLLILLGFQSLPRLRLQTIMTDFLMPRRRNPICQINLSMPFSFSSSVAWFQV